MPRCLFFALLAIGIVRPAAAAAPWQSTALLSVGDELADDAALHVEELGETYWCPPDMVVAWVRVAAADAPTPWMLVSIKQGKVKSIIRQGKHSTLRAEVTASRYATPTAKPIRVEHDPTKGARLPTYVLPARGRAFISGQSMIFAGALVHPNVMEWDGTSFGPLSDHIPSAVAAGVAGIDETGDTLVNIALGMERKPKRVLGIYDGARFTPLVTDGEELPGIAHVKAELNGNTGFQPAFYSVPGGAFVKMQVEGAPYREGLFRIEPGRTELISPFGPREKGGLFGATAVTADVFLWSVSRNAQVIAATGAQPGTTLFLRAAGKLNTITPPLGPQPVRFFSGAFVSFDPPLYLYKSSRRTGPTIAEVAATEKQTVFDSFWLAGVEGKPRQMAYPESVAIPGAGQVTFTASGFVPRFRKFTAGVRGILITSDLHATIAQLASDRVGMSIALASDLASEVLDGTSVFLAEGADALTRPPVLETDRGEVALLSVIGFADDRRAFARVGESIVELKATGKAIAME